LQRKREKGQLTVVAKGPRGGDTPSISGAGRSPLLGKTAKKKKKKGIPVGEGPQTS